MDIKMRMDLFIRHVIFDWSVYYTQMISVYYAVYIKRSVEGVDNVKLHFKNSHSFIESTFIVKKWRI